MEERLQKIISRSGIASRRQAEELIIEGRVRVNGRVVASLGAKADPNQDDIRVGSRRIGREKPKSTWAFYKPTGVVCTQGEDESRRPVEEFVPKKLQRLSLKPVGRLDYEGQGLLLFTNDGELAHRLEQEKNTMTRVYEVKIRGHLKPRDIKQFEKGVYLGERSRALPAKIELMSTMESASWVRVEIQQRSNWLVRRMCEATGHQVSKLKRVSVGPVQLGKLRVGAFRELTPIELQKLYEAVGL